MPTVSMQSKHKHFLDEVSPHMATALDEVVEGYKAYRAMGENNPTGDYEAEFDLDQINPNPYQVREVVEAEGIKELAYDIYQRGLLQVPMGRVLPDGTPEQAFGHRRKKALDFIVARGKEGHEDFPDWQKFTKMRLLIKPLTDRDMYDYMAAENGHRSDPNAIEIALSIQTGQEKFGLTLEEAAKPHGISSKGQASDLKSLLLLPKQTQHLIATKQFGSKGDGKGHGRELVRLVRAGFEANVVNRIAVNAVEQDLSVSLLKKQVDNEINIHKLKTEKVTRFCPNPTCGSPVEMSLYQVNMQANEWHKCEKCKDAARVSQWYTPEKQADMEKLQAQVAAAKSQPVTSGSGGSRSGGASSYQQTAFVPPPVAASMAEVSVPPPAAEPVAEVPPTPPDENTKKKKLAQDIAEAIEKLSLTTVERIYSFVASLNG